ncbi:MAG: DUF1624 domain-containing protein [Methanomicrobiales archaeon]|nr:DUF1624 domain-containing protein [Methanomicrobiales archaeon]
MSGVRYWEIDALRGTAVVMMVIFHTVFSLAFFGMVAVDVVHGFWRGFALATATLFIVMAGVSVTISSSRAAALGRRGVAWKNLRRGTGIFIAGMAITLVTWLFVPGEYVLFGVLQCIGLSIALSPLFLPLGRENLLVGAGVVLLAPLVGSISGPLALAWLGIHPPDFASLDYVPLFPWLGVFLLGMGLGTLLYPGGRRGFPAQDGERQPLAPVTFLGRHSLVIYLVHVPVILLVLTLLVPGFAGRLLSLVSG